MCAQNWKMESVNVGMVSEVAEFLRFYSDAHCISTSACYELIIIRRFYGSESQHGFHVTA